MNIFRRVLRQSKTMWMRSAYRKPVHIALDHPVVSLTFDDVPLSAYQLGVPILKEHNVKATFYVALGINSERSQFLGPAEVVDLLKTGHEIGCHTYSHYRLSAGNPRDLALDAKKNREQLGRLLGHNNEPRNFSFPYGEISLGAKDKLRNSYQSLRSSGPASITAWRILTA